MDKHVDNIKPNKELLADILSELKIMKRDTHDIRADLSYIKSILKVGETYPKPTEEDPKEVASGWFW